MNLFRRGLFGDESLFEYVQELYLQKTRLELEAAICWDMYGLPDGSVNPTHRSGMHMLMFPENSNVNETFNGVLQKLLPRNKQWLIEIPRRIAKLNAFDARQYLSTKGGVAIVLPLGAFGGLFIFNEIFHVLYNEKELPTRLREFISGSLPQLMARWLLCQESDESTIETNYESELYALLEIKRWQFQTKTETRFSIWATTIIQQLFLLLHEFGHLVNSDIKSLKKHASLARPILFHGSDNEIEADQWAIELLNQGIDGICHARSELIEQALFLLFGALHFMRQHGYLLNAETDQYEQRWLQIVKNVDPIGNKYTETMNRRLLSMFGDFYMGRTNRYNVGSIANEDEDAQFESLMKSENDEALAIAIEWNDKGCDYSEDRNLTDAIPCFKKAIEIFPEYAEAYCNLANCYDDLGLFDQSIETFEIATRCITDPDRTATIWENMGIAYSRKGNQANAMECSKIAMRIIYESTSIRRRKT